MNAGPALVFHRGALGDNVLIWPALRTLRAAGREVTLITDAEKAALAARWLGVRGESIERAEFNALWADAGPVASDSGPSLVISTVARDGETWARRAKERWPGAAFIFAPGPLDRAAALELETRLGGPAPVALNNTPGGPAVLHLGAGSGAKRWPVDRWAALRDAIDGPVSVIAGEVEAERFTAGERSVFTAMGGRFIGSLAELAEELRRARVLVAADSGPGHLAAQLGKPVVSLFGPTDPARWAPIGPDVRVIAPERAAPMTWLSVERVVEEVSPQRHGGYREEQH